MSKQSDTVLLCEQKESIVYLTMNRPDVLNALNKPLLRALKEQLEFRGQEFRGHLT